MLVGIFKNFIADTCVGWARQEKFDSKWDPWQVPRRQNPKMCRLCRQSAEQTLPGALNDLGWYSEYLSSLRMMAVVQWISLFPCSYQNKALSHLLSDAGKLCSKISICGNCCPNVPFLTCLVTSFKLEIGPGESCPNIHQPCKLAEYEQLVVGGSSRSWVKRLFCEMRIRVLQHSPGRWRLANCDMTSTTITTKLFIAVHRPWKWNLGP